MSREIRVQTITETVCDLCIRANCILPSENIAALRHAATVEKSPSGRGALERIVRNHELARENMQSACQDTGLAVVFIKLGQEVHITGGSLEDAVNEGVRSGYSQGYLRKSVVDDPLFGRQNTGDNTPAIIHLELVPGDCLDITVAPKGGGAENMSSLAMLYPSAGLEGVRKHVLSTVEKAGPNACPPMIVGVGVGGNFEMVALLAKKALMRAVGSRNPDPRYAALEDELLSEVNKLGIGPQGFGGSTTALDVHIEYAPCHIASLPVAVNLNCHVSPHASASL